MLCECHAHIALSGSDWKAALARHEQQPNEAAVRDELSRYAKRGVTYVRDGGDRFGACRLAAALAPEYGIDYSSPSFPLYQRGNYGSFIGRGFDDLNEACQLVDEAQDQGARFIKLMATGILSFSEFAAVSGYCLDEKLLGGIIDYVHGKGLSVMVHVNGAEAISKVANAGADSIEHGFYADDTSIDTMANAGCIWTPTFTPLANVVGTGVGNDGVLRQILRVHERSVAKAAEAGVPIACGSDAGAGFVCHGQGCEDEMGYLSKALGNDAKTIVSGANSALRKRF